jgi:hypothetical protein
MKSLVWQKRVRQLDGNKKEQEEEGLHCMRSYPGHSTLYWQRHILVGDLDSHCRFEEATSCGTELDMKFCQEFSRFLRD